MALSCMKDSEFKIRCNDCNFSSIIFTNSYDVKRTISFHLNNINSEISKHCVAHNHSMNVSIACEDIVQFKNPRDIYIAKHLL